MATFKPVKQILKFTDARRDLSQLLNQVHRCEKQVVVQKSGVPVAVIISVADFERLNRLDEERQRDFAVLHEAHELFKDVPAEEVQQEVGRAIAEVRAESRARNQTALSPR